MNTFINQLKSKIKINSKKELIDLLTKAVFLFFTFISASFILVIIIFVAEEGIKPFVSDNDGLGPVNLVRFLTGTDWLKGATFASNLYSVGFIIVNTLYIAFLALLLAMPIGVLTALFIAKIAPKKLAAILRTVVELLAAIPSIVYGLFGSGVILK